MSTLTVQKSVTNSKTTLSDNDGNQLIIKGANAKFENDYRLVVKVLSMKDIEKILEESKGTNEEKEIKEAYDFITKVLGGKKLAYYIESFVEDKDGNVVDYNSHMSGFTLKIKLDKNTYKKLGNINLAVLDERAGKLGNPIKYSYDEANELIVTNIDKPCILLAYEQPSEKTKTTNKSKNPKTGDNVIFYVSMLGVSVIGIVGIVIYTKKKSNKKVN